MKVLHIIRDSRPGNFSIEQIFLHVREELSNQIDFSVFQPRRIFDLMSVIKVKEYSLDVNHITGDVNYLMYGLNGSNSIITVHDIGHFTNTLRGFKKYVYGHIWYTKPLSKVQFITTISSFTADQLNRHFNVPYKKIEVIPDPLLPIFQTQKLTNSLINRQFTILQIGSGSNKNIFRLIDAIRGLDCKLILVRMQNPIIENLLIHNKVKFEWKFDLDQESLVKTYLSADLLFFASTYEGFGMPIIEAQSLGIPVITSHIQPMKEVAGDNGALFVDPFSVQAIRRAILLIKENVDLRLSLLESGFNNVKRFQITSVSNSYLQLYQYIVGRG